MKYFLKFLKNDRKKLLTFLYLKLNESFLNMKKYSWITFFSFLNDQKLQNLFFSQF